MTLNTLFAISPIDGRYTKKTSSLIPFFSEYALIFYRVKVEIKWLISLTNHPDMTEAPVLSEEELAFLNNIIDSFSESDALLVKSHEQKTNHDVKSIEYFIQDKLTPHPTLKQYIPFIHFALTSEDINNIAYALMIKDALAQVIQPALAELMGGIMLLGKQHADVPMLSRTHGQPATPTTIGKELINFVARLKRPQQQLSEVLISAKCNGAVGNYNAHVVAYPDIDWRKHAQNFVQQLGLSFTPYSTQIEPHDGIAEISHLFIRINNIFLDYTKDIWHYISLGYFSQKAIEGEVGSSTMPHKINPIDFENAEGNLGMANALFGHFASKLTQSRFQRDLSDSTVLRNLGVTFAYSLIAYQSIAKGNSKLDIDISALTCDLENEWSVLAEAIQTVMRKHHIENAYEQLKSLTRGRKAPLTKTQLHTFIDSLAIPNADKAQLKNLTPMNYTGLATSLVKTFL
jgi:adenylosuccinate lyase